jgi:hypothetical protein
MSTPITGKILWQFVLVLPALLSLGINRILSGPETLLLAIVITLGSSLYLARALRLFRSDDLVLFDLIQMPSSLKKAIVRAYPYLTTDPKHGDEEVIS